MRPRLLVDKQDQRQRERAAIVQQIALEKRIPGGAVGRVFQCGSINNHQTRARLLLRKRDRFEQPDVAGGSRRVHRDARGRPCGGQGSRLRDPLPFDDAMAFACLYAGDRLDRTRGPSNCDLLRDLSGTQSQVDAFRVLAQITGARADQLRSRAVSRLGHNPRADGIAIGLHAFKFEHNDIGVLRRIEQRLNLRSQAVLENQVETTVAG